MQIGMAGGGRLHAYATGTMGPAAADWLIQPDGQRWWHSV
jgi:glucose-6-phosphate 1-dehydrogenase